jgi:sugar lactone lactonase YvrE
VTIDAAGAATRRIALPPEGSHSDLAVLADGTVLILDPAQARLLRAAPGETQATAWASLRERAEFPVALATDPAGRLVVLDRHGGGVVIVHPDGAAEARQIDAGWREGELRYPSGLCLDEVGRLFVADTDNGRVQMFQLAP